MGIKFFAMVLVVSLVTISGEHGAGIKRTIYLLKRFPKSNIIVFRRPVVLEEGASSGEDVHPDMCKRLPVVLVGFAVFDVMGDLSKLNLAFFGLSSRFKGKLC